MTNLNPYLLRRTKILATLGPATDSEAMMEKIIRAGVNVVRLNFSHGSHEDHAKRIQMVRSIAKKLGRTIGILADLQGPKIRISSFKNGSIELHNGESFILDAALAENAGSNERVGIDYKALPNDVKAGDTLLLDDGRITLTVKKVAGKEIVCEVVDGGVLSNHKGINRQGGGLSAKALTDKDKNDIKFVLTQDVDYVAISFPRNAEDVNEARQLVDNSKGFIGIIAKIERTEAVANIDSIVEASDGVMVARGDLAVEIGDAEVPLVQKNIIHRARSMDRPVIIATQMMESMIHSPVPTRAEVSDVATAVLENADAVMLSAETAAGEYPDKTVEAMARVCLAVEQQPNSQISRHRVECQFQRVDEAIAMATMYTANHFNIKAVVALTESGATTLWMSRIRTAMPIYGLSRCPKALGRMSLYRGVYPVEFDVTQCKREEVNKKTIAYMQELGVLRKDELVILTKGDSLGIGGGSNAMKIVKVGHVE